MKEMTGAEYGLSGEDQIRIVARYIAQHGGVARMRDLYRALEDEMEGHVLSDQGRSSLRFFVNEVAVDRGWIQPFDRHNPGWRLTSAGYRLIGEEPPVVDRAASDQSRPSRTAEEVLADLERAIEESRSAQPMMQDADDGSPPPPGTTEAGDRENPIAGLIDVLSTVRMSVGESDMAPMHLEVAGSFTAVSNILARLADPLPVSSLSVSAQKRDGQWTVSLSLN